MSLTPGTRLGVYDITAQIGEGGMGAVYRATDTSLGRQVAIKVLPDAFAQDAERLARFEREAKTLAALNHPNIAAIYGLERSSGTLALVMELVEGDDLSQRIARGAIPLDEALPIAKQIAEALEAAHEQGIIHRDLKPANIKVRSDGTVKVLDFGLAKAMEPAAGSSPSMSMSPTITTPAMTQAGMILGTAAYMSPEQARGRAVDKRADIWSFGAVLFEMLTDTRPFDGEDIAETLGAVIHKEPAWSRLPASIPVSVRTVLQRCLQKDPRQRLRDIGDVRLALEGAFETAARTIIESRVRPGLKIGPYGWVAAGLLLVVTAGLGMSILRHREPVDVGSVRLAVAPPDGWTVGHTGTNRGRNTPAPHFAVSPDGRRLAYVMYATGRQPQLWVKRLDALDGQPLPGTDDASFPFWSTDGRFIAFFASGKLKKIDPSGGSPQTICDAPAGEGGTWNRDDDIVFAPGGSGPLSRVSSAGGVPTPLTTLDASAQEVSHLWPQFLPDGRHFLFLAGGTTTDLFVGSLDSPDRSLVMKGAERALYASGHVLFVRKATLMAQPFDAATLRLSGEPTPVAEDVAVNTENHRTGFSVSESGVLAYRTGGLVQEQSRQITRFDRSGKRLEVVGTPGALSYLRLAPGDAALAVRINESASLGDWWILDLTRGGLAARLTSGSGAVGTAFWSPDGTKLVFGSGAPIVDWYQKSVTGSGERELVLKTSFSKGDGDWSQQAQHIIYSEARPETDLDLWVLPLTKDAQPRAFVQTKFRESGPRFSPDGRWVAYVSDEGGVADVYVRAFPSGDRKARVSVAGGDNPVWRRDGRELFYLQGTTVMAVDVRTGADFGSAPPHELFQTQMNLPVAGYFDATGSGQQFLVAALSTGTTRAITLVVNWPSLLKK